jgi:hypothetical protein
MGLSSLPNSQAALAAAKARGQALGNPRLSEARAMANAAHKAVAGAHAETIAPAIREAQAAGAKSLRPECSGHCNGAGREVGSTDGGERSETSRRLARRVAPLPRQTALVSGTSVGLRSTARATFPLL